MTGNSPESVITNCTFDLIFLCCVVFLIFFPDFFFSVHPLRESNKQQVQVETSGTKVAKQRSGTVELYCSRCFSFYLEQVNTEVRTRSRLLPKQTRKKCNHYLYTCPIGRWQPLKCRVVELPGLDDPHDGAGKNPAVTTAHNRQRPLLTFGVTYYTELTAACTFS